MSSAPPTSRFANELSTALSAAHQAAALIMEVYAGEFSVEYKAANDPVTQADQRANELIVRALTAAFPRDGICSEEGVEEDSRVAASRPGRCWFVDPLDGTREFVDRNGEFCVMIGLAIDGIALLGVIVAPVWKRTFWGIVGEGAFERDADGTDRPVKPAPSPKDLSKARMVGSRSHVDSAAQAVATALDVRQIRPCGSVGLKAMLVATGEADLYVHNGRGPKLWDGCAPDAIARAAGAFFSNGFGKPLRYNSGQIALDRGIVVGEQVLHSAAIRSLAKHLEKRKT